MVDLMSCKSESDNVWKRAFTEAAIWFVLSSILLITGFLFAFDKFHPEFRGFTNFNASDTSIPGSKFRPVRSGTAGLVNQVRVINTLQNGEVVLSARTSFPAENYPFIKFNIDDLTTRANAYLFWRRADAPDIINHLPLTHSDSGVAQLAMPSASEDYRGKIIELTIAFFSDPTDHGIEEQPIRLRGVELRAFSKRRVLTQIFEDWMAPPLWQGRANNVVYGAHKNSLILPNIAVTSTVVSGALLALLWRLIRCPSWRRTGAEVLAIALCLSLYGWAANDLLRWQWRARQIEDNHLRYYNLPLEERIKHNAVRCGRRADCYEKLLPYF